MRNVLLAPKVLLMRFWRTVPSGDGEQGLWQSESPCLQVETVPPISNQTAAHKAQRTKTSLWFLKPDEIPMSLFKITALNSHLWILYEWSQDGKTGSDLDAFWCGDSDQGASLDLKGCVVTWKVTLRGLNESWWNFPGGPMVRMSPSKSCGFNSRLGN